MKAHAEAREAMREALRVLQPIPFSSTIESAIDRALEGVAGVVETLDPIEVALRGVDPVLELLRGEA